MDYDSISQQSEIMFNSPILKTVNYELIEISGWIRLYQSKFPSPLGIGSRPSRFCDPKYNLSVLYLAMNLKTSFVEVLVRDKHDGLTQLTISQDSLREIRIAEISSILPLRIVNLTSDNMITQGLPSDIVGSSDHAEGQKFSASLYHSRPDIDGILYPSRLVHDAICLGIYDRAIYKLTARLGRTLDVDARIPEIMKSLRISRDTKEAIERGAEQW